MFNVIWITAATLTLVPLAIACLRGWSPAWMGGPTTQKLAKARGIAAFAIYGSALTPAVLALLGVPDDELLALRIILGPILLAAVLLLVLRTTIQERRKGANSRAV